VTTTLLMVLRLQPKTRNAFFLEKRPPTWSGGGQ
jgi:hypothetical protein